jgi:glycosyltransferase involved in cell wall biosynthesis
MKIAILASNFIRIPPRQQDVPMGYSGAPEQIVHRITEGLVKKGHQVTLFASGDSRTAASLISVTPIASAKNKNIGVGLHESFEYLLISRAYQMAKNGSFDIIHSHFDRKSAYFAPLVATPTVSTLHSPLEKVREILKEYKNSQYYVSISNEQRHALPDLNYVATIYHGIDLPTYLFDDREGSYLLFVGRIVPEKGAHIAIKVSRSLRIKLILLGWAARKNMKYYQEKVKPYIEGKNIENHGYINRESLKEYLRKAKMLLFPISWEEPFGLVMIEAMACGTPVVAYARGSVPEIVIDGVTGFIVNYSDNDQRGEWIIKKTGLEGFIEAVNRLNSMSKKDYQRMRMNCRKHIEEKFTVEKMVEGYERAYQKVLEGK